MKNQKPTENSEDSTVEVSPLQKLQDTIMKYSGFLGPNRVAIQTEVTEARSVLEALGNELDQLARMVGLETVSTPMEPTVTRAKRAASAKPRAKRTSKSGGPSWNEFLLSQLSKHKGGIAPKGLVPAVEAEAKRRGTVLKNASGMLNTYLYKLKKDGQAVSSDGLWKVA